MISVKQLMFVLKLFQVSAGSIHCFGIRKETLRFMHPKVSGFGYDTKNSPSFLDFSKETKYPFSNKIWIWIVVKKPPLTETTSWELELYHNYIVESGNSDCKSFRSKLFRTDYKTFYESETTQPCMD